MKQRFSAKIDFDFMLQYKEEKSKWFNIFTEYLRCIQYQYLDVVQFPNYFDSFETFGIMNIV